MTELRALTESHFMDTFRLRLAPGQERAGESRVYRIRHVVPEV